MEMGGGALADIQAELYEIKKALRSDTGYLGMKGETLHSYLLQLNQKENILLSKQISHMTLENGPNSPNTFIAGGAAPPQARPPPSGTPKAFNKSDISEVLAHMCDYEAVPLESTKALRALSALAYENAAKVGADGQALQQLLRLLAIHPGDAMLTLAAIRALCNMAYDQAVALTTLTEGPVLTALIASMARYPAPHEIGARASEAIARVVAAEMHPEGEATALAAPAGGFTAISGLFLAAAGGGEDTLRGVMPRLALQLVQNEVVEPATLAARFVGTGESGGQASAVLAAGWLVLAKQLSASDVPGLAQGLVDAGGIKVAGALMERHLNDGAVQLGGIEAMSSLVGNRWAGLQAFAKARCMSRIEAAMKAHVGDVLLQTKGIRALASGTQWPEDIQEASGYNSKRAVECTKVAMGSHGANVELVTAAMEALSKYVEGSKCVAELCDSGGEGVVKATLARHPDVEKVQHCGKLILDRISGKAPAKAG